MMAFYVKNLKCKYVYWSYVCVILAIEVLSYVLALFLSSGLRGIFRALKLCRILSVVIVGLLGYEWSTYEEENEQNEL